MIRISSRMTATLGGIAVSLLTTIAAPAQNAALPNWPVNAKIVAKLAPPQNLNGYSVRLPRGYKQVVNNKMRVGKGMIYQHTYIAEPKSDGSIGNVFVVVTNGLPHLGPDEQDARANRILHSTVQYATEKHQNVSISETEYGQVHGKPIARLQFSFVDTIHGKPVQYYGFYCVRLDDTTSITVGSMDFEPNSQKSLPLAEATAFTVLKK